MSLVNFLINHFMILEDDEVDHHERTPLVHPLLMNYFMRLTQDEIDRMLPQFSALLQRFPKEIALQICLLSSESTDHFDPDAICRFCVHHSSASLFARITSRLLNHHPHEPNNCISIVTSKFPLQPMQFCFLSHRDAWPFENPRVCEDFWMGVTTDPVGSRVACPSFVRVNWKTLVLAIKNKSCSPSNAGPLLPLLKRMQLVHDGALGVREGQAEIPPLIGRRRHSMFGIAVDYDRHQILFTRPIGNKWYVWRSRLPDNQRNKLLFPIVWVKNGCRLRDLRLARLSSIPLCSPEAPIPAAATGEDAQDEVLTGADPAPSHDFNFSVASSIAIGILSSAIIMRVFMIRRPRHS
jgi:hypothetical protein